MFIDGRQLESETTLRADIGILGGGAAGITLALALADSGRKVCLLESGGPAPDPETQALYEGRMTGIDTWSLRQQRVRALGGSTGHWSGWCMPLDPEDFIARSWVPHSGWPVGIEELAPWYPQAQRRLELGPFQYDAERQAEAEGMPLLASPGGRLESKLFQLSTPTRFGVAYRDALADASNVLACLYANALEIVVSEESPRVDRVRFATLAGERHALEADRFVLALGGLENPRLLLASNRQREAGVANSSGAVGRYFMEHPHFYPGALWLADTHEPWRFYARRNARLAGAAESVARPLLGVLGATREARRRERLPDFHLELGFPRDAADAVAPVRAADVARLVAGGRSGLRPIWMSARFEQTPLAESRVTLGPERDALGMARIALHWAIRRDDWIAYRRALRLVGAELAAAGLGRLWSPTDETGAFRWRPSPGGHHMGTTRMAAKPDHGVVNGDGRSFDHPNLYIAGSSVFPTSGVGNPTLTIVALAERLADHLGKT